ncbi:MAG: hypothetical protein ABID83_01085 [Candidatus Omnitrophota bacterium]
MKGKLDRRDFLKYVLCLGVSIVAWILGFREKEGFRVGKIRNLRLGSPEAHAMCGTAYACAGGGGDCGTSYACAGGGGSCGTAYNCAGEGQGGPSGGDGMCGTAYACAGGGGACGTAYNCAGGGGECGTAYDCAGK